jgi:hypothetical protein
MANAVTDGRADARARTARRPSLGRGPPRAAARRSARAITPSDDHPRVSRAWPLLPAPAKVTLNATRPHTRTHTTDMAHDAVYLMRDVLCGEQELPTRG